MNPRPRSNVFFAALFLATCALIDLSRRSDGAVATTEPAETWAARPTEEWPQLVLTNKASFDGHTALNGASAFLMRMPNGEVVVATAKHLIGTAGGVKPPIPLADMDHALQHWLVFPRTKLDDSIEAKGIAITARRENTHDWLLLHLADPSAIYPSAPLTPRSRPAQIGETIYLVGVPYSDHHSPQNIYKGVVTARPFLTYFKYEFTPPVHISGFSGAPIVDSHGLLIGHGVSKFELKQQDGLEVEFGGEDSSVALSLWKHRNDPATTKPITAIRLDLPDGWVTMPKKAGVLKFARHPDTAACLELVTEAKDDFADGVDLMAWARLVKANATRGSTLVNREETDLKEGKIGDRATVEYEITGEFLIAKLHYRIILVELNGHYCKFIFWTTPSHWDDAQQVFEDAVKTLK